MNTNRHAPDDEVRTLKRMVDRHLSEPHIFQCVSEHHIDGIHNVQPINDIPGWWGKINLFSGAVSHTRNLFLDTDMVVTGSLDELVAPLVDSQLRIGLNWAASGHLGCQSGIMYWEGVAARVIYDKFDRKDAHWPPRNDLFWKVPGHRNPLGQCQWGDQEWMSALRDTNQLSVEYFDSEHVKSYKYHCRGSGLPDNTRVVSFHGKPNPGDVNDEWVIKARQ